MEVYGTAAQKGYIVPKTVNIWEMKHIKSCGPATT